jgi:MATE family multidrug resistance protein
MSRIDISYRRIARIATPVLLGQLSYTAMGVVDTVMVGQLGVTALAGVGIGNILVWWLLSLFWGMLAGVNTLVAQAVGAEDRPGAGVALWQGLYLGLLCTSCILALWPAVPLLFELAGTSPEVQAIAVEYMQIRLLGGFGLMVLMVADNFYRGLGRTDIPMWCGFVKLFINCGLNYVFIFGKLGAPALGTAGAALGTIIANTVVGGLMLAIMFVRSDFRRDYGLLEGWRLDPRVFRSLVRLSLPIGIQTFMEMGGISVFMAIVGRLGDAQLAATNAVIQAWSVAFMMGFSLSVCATTLVGQCIGAGEPLEARVVTRRVLRVGSVMMAALGVVYMSVPERLMAVFVEGERVVELLPYARPLFTIVTVCLLLDLTYMVLWGALRGAGDTVYSMVVNIGSAWLLFVPATLLAAPRWGLIGAWSCLILHLGVMALLMEVRFRGQAWVRAPAVEREPVLAAAEVDVEAAPSA